MAVKDVWDRECKYCSYGSYTSERLTFDPYYSTSFEGVCEYDFDCPYLSEKEDKE